jgi:hypothetical protein
MIGSVVEKRDIGRRACFGIFAAGIFAWAFALTLTQDIDFVALFANVPDPWRAALTAPFRTPLLPFCLAVSAGLGMVMLVIDAPRRLKVYGALLAFTAPMYAAARLLATA